MKDFNDYADVYREEPAKGPRAYAWGWKRLLLCGGKKINGSGFKGY